MMDNMGDSAFYRSDDSVDNFRLKVFVRELSKVIRREEGDAAGSDGPIEEEIILSWQEKMYGPADVAEFLKHKDSTFKTKDAHEADTYRHMASLEEKGKPMTNLLKPVMFYTYTDKSNKLPRGSGPVRYNEDENMEPYLSVATTHHANADVGGRERKVNERFYREKPHKVMHVCMATDVDVEALKNKPIYPAAHYVEHLLCSITVFNDGLIECVPEFSKNLDEERKRGAETVIPSVFMNDETVAASLKKHMGMKLRTYQVNSMNGRTYEYNIQNMNDYFSPLDIDEKRKQDLAKDAINARNCRVTESITKGESDTSIWRQDPPSKGYAKSLVYYAEIVSGSGFEGDRLFVDYEVVVPQGWNLRTGNLVDGVGEQDLVNKAMGLDTSVDGGGGEIGQQLALNLLESDGYLDGEEARGMLHGVTQMSEVSERRGGIILPVLRPFWRGNRLRHSFDPIARNVLGLGFFFYNCLCVILGVHYPFWVVSALVFLFALGSGHPGGSSQAVLQTKSLGEKGSGQSKDNKNHVLAGPLVSATVANFNHLINLSFDVKDLDISKVMNSPSSTVPTIVFTVYSVGALGRINIEGYSYYHMPEKAGQIEATIRTWKPTGGIETQMRNYFLGSPPHIIDRANFYASDKNPHGKPARSVLNHFGVRTENSGEIRFRINVASTEPSKMKPVVVGKDMSQEKKLAGARRTVDQILKTYRSGTSIEKSIDFVQSTGGFSSAMIRGGVENSTDLSKRAEMLIAQAKSRISTASTSSAKLGSPDAKSAVRDEYTRQREVDSADSKSGESGREDEPLLASRSGVQMAPLQMEKVTGIRKEPRRYAGAQDGEGDSLLGNDEL